MGRVPIFTSFNKSKQHSFLFPVILGFRTANLRRKAGARTDDRVMQMNEIIQSMQVIKMYAWENAFADLIRLLRKCVSHLLLTSLTAFDVFPGVNSTF